MDETQIAAILSVFDTKLATDPQIRAILRKITGGKATFADTADYAIRAGNLLGQFLSGEILDISPEGREVLCAALLKKRYTDLNKLLGTVQRAQDKPLGISLNPIKAPFPAERVQQVAHSLLDPGVKPEVIRRRANAPVATVAKSFHDDYIRINAQKRNDLGFKCYLNRVAVNGCCSWCTEVAGRYVYGDHPADIFRRHDNCDCTVTFENGRQRQDVWSKRTWDADPEEVLQDTSEPTVLSQDAAESLQNAAVGRLTFSTERGILNVGTDGMFRRKDDSKIEPMPKKQFRQILKAFKAQGGLIQFDDATDAYLESRNAEAITYDAKTILIRQKPGRASVFEELIHTAQYRNGRNDGSYPSRLQCEIEAQEKLLKYAKAYKLTEPEIEQTRKALKAYRKELDAYYKNGGES